MPSSSLPPDMRAWFWSQVDKGPGPEACWLWIGPLTSHGHGCCVLPGPDGPQVRQAHEVAWELAHGPIPAGMRVRHQPPCLTKKCVRHLRLALEDPMPHP